ncbi:RNA 2',3'-cyclic phosphodiesterase [Balneolaceae bacterium ANBcel3]|nr:RNA 2',3'-cyclic phosphodiesterase [Balneolaceae bacterium ANBcel3]
MRLFTAITIPDHVRGELAAIQPQHPEIHLTPESQLHLTMRFIGDCDKNKTRRISQVLTHVSFRPFDLTLQGTGTFRSEETTSILWAGVRYNDVLGELYESIQQELYRAKVAPENRTFHPHVTLGRVRRGHRGKPAGEEDPPLTSVLDDFFEGPAASFETTFHVDRFHLYHSRLHSGGAIHHLLQEYLAY